MKSTNNVGCSQEKNIYKYIEKHPHPPIRRGAPAPVLRLHVGRLQRNHDHFRLKSWRMRVATPCFVSGT